MDDGRCAWCGRELENPVRECCSPGCLALVQKAVEAMEDAWLVDRENGLHEAIHVIDRFDPLRRS